MVKDSKTALERFHSAQEEAHDMREQSREEDRFCLDKDGQWEDRVITAMGNRPRFTFDKTNPLIDDIMSEVDGMDFGIRVRPAGGGATKELAETYAGIIRYIENLSDAPTVYRQATRRIARRGIDFIRVSTDWVGESFEQDILIQSIPDSINRVWLGYHEKQDGSDANEAFQLRAMPADEFEEMYGRKCQSVYSDDMDSETDNDTAVFLEYLYVKPYKKTVLLMSDGKTYELDKIEPVLDEMAAKGIKEARRRSIECKRVYSRFLDAQDWLSKEMETVWSGIPVVPVYGNFEVSEGEVTYCSVTRRLMDPQRVYNYARSREIEEGALAPRRKLLMTAKQLSNKLTQKQVSEMNVSSDPVLVYTVDGEAPPPFETSGPQINPNLAATAQTSNQDMVEGAGVYSAQQAANPRYQSGWAVEQMISKGDSKTTKWLNSTAVAVRRIAQLIIEAIPKVYDSKRQIRIMGNDGTDELVTINEEVLDVQTNRVVVVNDLSQGKYDVVIDFDKAYKSRRQEAAERLINMASVDPTLLQDAADIVYDSLDISGAEQIKERRRLTMLKNGMIPDSQMTDEEKQMADELLQQQAVQAQQMQQQQAPVTQSLIANYESLIREREVKTAKMIEDMQLAQEKMVADIAKQQQDFALKLTELEQKYSTQLNQEFANNLTVQ